MRGPQLWSPHEANIDVPGPRRPGTADASYVPRELHLGGRVSRMSGIGSGMEALYLVPSGSTEGTKVNTDAEDQLVTSWQWQ